MASSVPDVDGEKDTEPLEFMKWQNLVAPANGAKAEKPILIVQGLNDTAVLPQITNL